MRMQLLAAGVCLALTGAAGPLRAEAPVIRAELSFQTYAAGLPILDLTTTFSIGPWNYEIDSRARSTGVAALFHPGEQTAEAFGTWSGDRAVPARYVSRGEWSGQPRRVLIEYENGWPRLRELEPLVDRERSPVPPEATAHATNMLSVLAQMVRQVSRTGRCEMSARIFDGRAVSELRSWTAGIAELHEDAYSGPALRCDYEGRFVAGFFSEASEDERASAAPRGSVWLGRVFADAPPLPVRLSFATHWFGPAVAHLVQAHQIQAPYQQSFAPRAGQERGGR